MKQFIDRLISQKQAISQEEYDSWREHPVTRRLMIEIQIDMLETATPKAHGGVESCGMMAARDTAHYECLEEVFKWKPEELLDE